MEQKHVVVQKTPIQSTNNVDLGLNFSPPVGMSNANYQQMSNQIPQQQFSNQIPQQQYTNQINRHPVQQQVMGGFYGGPRN